MELDYKTLFEICASLLGAGGVGGLLYKLKNSSCLFKTEKGHLTFDVQFPEGEKAESEKKPEEIELKPHDIV